MIVLPFEGSSLTTPPPPETKVTQYPIYIVVNTTLATNHAEIYNTRATVYSKCINGYLGLKRA